MQILSIISLSVTIVIYFFLSLFLPFLGYLVPYYKITRINLKEKKYRFLINITVAGILLLLNFKLFLIYLVFPVITESMFYLTNIFPKKLKIYDRVIIMSILSTIIVSVYISKINLDVSAVENILKDSRIISVNIGEFMSTFNYIKENIIYSSFSYFFMANILLIFTLNKNAYSNWKISPYWLIIFIGIIFIDKFMGISISSFWSRNLIEVVKYIYIWYSMKFIYNLCSFTRVNILKHLISLVLVITYPTVAFVLGALASFDIIEVENKKI